ncbi:hypothetical protein HanXRQr2_Chr05g0208651 [Helianthus annuus]|uniref:Uncharacterized protein n=1 Tax=Helianthus annuus TaxID=4232 RepID=A0A9K3IZ33_HELAN|nr:hypothetical protein HanXRQr2_Chr05g0208651 [Helianthus annuus]
MYMEKIMTELDTVVWHFEVQRFYQNAIVFFFLDDLLFCSLISQLGQQLNGSTGSAA